MKIVTLRDDNGEIVGVNKAVFFDNIRDFNPNSKINKEISAILSAGGQDNFVFQNNGITVVSKSLNRVGNSFTIGDFQIVNGCQTSNILFNNIDHIDGVHVPFRLISTKDDDFIFSIISGTNKQNPVREEQFWSLLPFMKNLEEFAKSEIPSKKVFLERRENQYRAEAVEKARIVQMQPFLKAITASILGSPHRAARNYKSEVKDQIDTIFAEGEDVRPAYAVSLLHYRLEFMWRNQKLDASTKIFRYFIMDAATVSILGHLKLGNLSKKDKAKFASELEKLALDEKRLSAVVQLVSKNLTSRLKTMKVWNSRERLRDTIRSESFFLSVRPSYIPSKPTLA